MSTIDKIIKTVTVNSFAEYIQYIQDECGEDYFLFRGQREDSNKPNDLLPKIARENMSKLIDIIPFEMKLFEDFKKFSVPYIEKNLPENDWGWLTLAQHHGLPTRLLDWTKNPLAALWFVVNTPPKSYKSYGIIWMFRPDEDDYVNFSKDKSPFAVKKTKVFEPTHIARRITAQAACFTVHKYMDNKLKFLPLNKNKSYKHKLIRIKVDGDKHAKDGDKYAKMRSQLDRYGINAVTLFADLDNLCEHITWKNYRSSNLGNFLKKISL